MTLGGFKARFGSRISARRRGHPRRRQPRSRATSITIAPAGHSRRTAFAVRPRLTTT